VVVFAYHTLGARCLEALLARGERVAAVVTHEDAPDEARWFASVADLARGRGVPVFTPSSPNAPECVATLRALDADLFVSIMYRRLLGAELLRLPRIAAINLHPSLLPKYRGRAPVNWALVNGERRTGVTLHHMVEAADAGDVIAQEAVTIEPEDTAATLFRKIEAAGVALFARTYPAVAAGTAPRIPQDHAAATTFGRRRPEDGRVEWAWPARRIADMIRAVTHPFPGAFVGDGSARLWLWEGRAGAGAGVAPPGTLLEVSPGRGVTVSTGDGTLVATRVQEAGGPEERADQWASRHGLAPGAALAPPPSTRHARSSA
jgi:UDP-4-amino-4-deoxy-L-arabinose formyltransferase/UDP-glucuronic acid dehydrogenase (UDP-4-keto-hexauronic acid decarboxylating)